jgi:hypothetical protein
MAHCGQSPLQAFALLLPNRFLAAFIRELGLFELQEHIIGDVDVAERDSKPVAKFFLAKSRQIAFPAIAAAAVIRVAVLIEFSRHRAVVVGTVQQPEGYKRSMNL